LRAVFLFFFSKKKIFWSIGCLSYHKSTLFTLSVNSEGWDDGNHSPILINICIEKKIVAGTLQKIHLELVFNRAKQFRTLRIIAFLLLLCHSIKTEWKKSFLDVGQALK